MKKLKRTTTSIKDVAKKAGVSISTISRSLNESGYVKKELKEKIKNIANELNYKPNTIARCLRTRRSNTIGVIIPDLSNPYHTETIEAIEKIAKKANYEVLVTCTFYNKEMEKKQVDILKNRMIDGLIFVHGYYNYNYIDEIYSHEKIPLVCIDRIGVKNNIPLVTLDHEKAVKEAVKYLYENGHRKIAYMVYYDSEKIEPITYEKIKGYLNGLSENNLKYYDKYLYNTNPKGSKNKSNLGSINEMNLSYNYVKQNFISLKENDAILTAGDMDAIGACKALKEYGIKIPEHISVMGFNNISISGFFVPSITTVDNPAYEKGQKAMNLLLRKIETIKSGKIDDKFSLKIIIPSKIVVRESTKSIK